jgi:hypothetical protein
LALSPSIREADWKVFRALSPIALDRFCQRVLLEVTQTVSDVSKSNHKRFLDVYDLIRKRNKELANAFDDPRRSVALEQLVLMRRNQLLTDEEMARFSPETRESVNGLLDLLRR